MEIKDQIQELRDLFGVKGIYNRTTLTRFKNEEQLEIIEVIKKNKKDGVYFVLDRIQLVLRNGRAIIQDRDE